MKLKDVVSILILVVSLGILVAGMMGLMYRQGFYDGMGVICGDLSVGVTMDDEYVCYDEADNIPLTEDYDFQKGYDEVFG